MEEAAKTFEYFADLPPVLQWLIGIPVAAIAIAWYWRTLRNVARGEDERRDKNDGGAPPSLLAPSARDPGLAAFTLIAHTLPEMLSRLTIIHEGVVRMERQQAERDKDFKKLIDLAHGIERRFNRLLEKLGEPCDDEKED